MWQQFREFANRGNVVDLAVGIIIGAAFGKIVGSFVGDVLTPPLGLLVGNVDFSNLFIGLGSTPYASLAEARAAGAPTINYGAFINAVVEFSIVAFAVFLVVQAVARVKRAESTPDDAAAPRTCDFCRLRIHAEASRCPHCTSAL